MLTLTDWWAGILNRPDWVITRKCSKLPLIGPRLLKLPFRQVILIVMHLLHEAVIRVSWRGQVDTVSSVQ